MTKPPLWRYNQHCEQAGRLRTQRESARPRKVRAPQGGIAANGRRGRPQGKCNREIPPRKRQGWKGGVRAHQRAGDCAAMQTLFGATPQRDTQRLPGASREGGIEPRWQHPAKIDGCPRQNSAYRPGHTEKARRMILRAFSVNGARYISMTRTMVTPVRLRSFFRS